MCCFSKKRFNDAFNVLTRALASQICHTAAPGLVLAHGARAAWRSESAADLESESELIQGGRPDCNKIFNMSRLT
jgi:hypothetical protein